MVCVEKAEGKLRRVVCAEQGGEFVEQSSECVERGGVCFEKVKDKLRRVVSVLSRGVRVLRGWRVCCEEWCVC